MNIITNIWIIYVVGLLSRVMHGKYHLYIYGQHEKFQGRFVGFPRRQQRQKKQVQIDFHMVFTLTMF